MVNAPRVFRLTLGYDGSRYAGWQVQPNGPTIQAEIERAITELVHVPVHVVGSGRTDSGVHAIAQTASVALPQWNADAPALARAVNSKLPDDISVYACDEMPPGFHAMRDAVSKRYRYQVQIGGVRNVFACRYSWHVHYRMDIQAMRLAASHIVGTHDFACFQAAGSDRKSTVRTVFDLEIKTACDAPNDHRIGFDLPVPPQHQLVIEIQANGFLYNMVRNIVGSLVDVGRGKHNPDWIAELIHGKDRNRSGQTAPAQGLFLLRVHYDIQPINRSH